MPFITEITVRFGDCDPAGIVYYPVFFHYYHIALEEFFAARCGITYHDLREHERLGFPTVKSEAEFFVALTDGDKVTVEMDVLRVGHSSVTFVYRLMRDGQLCARAVNVNVCLDMDARRGVAIPEKYRRVLTALAEKGD
jgi:4-hydroxybenzoyl-CoA thioesterase